MKSLIFALFVFAFSFQLSADEKACLLASTTIEQKLKCIDGVTVQDTSTDGISEGALRVDLLFKQLVDHNNPERGTFQQKLALIHRSETEPMVLQTSGYQIFSVRETATTILFKTNQLQVEHRYFADSKPENLDWTLLNIKQSADDFHAITVAFKKIYTKNWVNTGASKGGMTSIYHRRFYPADLNGTIADVAPLSYSARDQRYSIFVENVGGAAYNTCRESLRTLQLRLLQNRDVITPMLPGSFNHLGTPDIAFEHAVLELPFAFWQYGNPEDASTGCEMIPTEGTPEQLYNYLSAVNSIDSYSDQGMAGFMPYYYQAATQLGSPDVFTAHLELLRRYEYNIDQYTPKTEKYSYANKAMHDVAAWVKTSAENIVFINGEFDPWSAGAFPEGMIEKEVRKFVVPRANHGAKFTNLLPDEKEAVVRLLSKWLGKDPAQTLTTKSLMKHKTLEDIEFVARRKQRL